MRKFAYDYYVVDVPVEVGSEEERINIAIAEAKDRANIWSTPANWTAKILDEDRVQVRRKRYFGVFRRGA